MKLPAEPRLLTKESQASSTTFGREKCLSGLGVAQCAVTTRRSPRSNTGGAPLRIAPQTGALARRGRTTTPSMHQGGRRAGRVRALTWVVECACALAAGAGLGGERGEVRGASLHSRSVPLQPFCPLHSRSVGALRGFGRQLRGFLILCRRTWIPGWNAAGVLMVAMTEEPGPSQGAVFLSRSC